MAKCPSYRSCDAVALLSQAADVGTEVPGVGRLEAVGEPGAGVPRLTDDESSVRRIVRSGGESVGRITGRESVGRIAGGGPAATVGHVFVVAGATAAADGRVRVLQVVAAGERWF